MTKSISPPTHEQRIKELRRPFNGWVKKIGEIINEFERLAGEPGGEFVDSIAVQEIKTKARNVQEVIKARRPQLHKPCEGKGCETCNNLGYQREN